MDKDEILVQYAYEFQGEWTKIARAIKTHHPPTHEMIQENYITIYDTNYPKQLRELRYPPWVLFYQGDLSLFTKPMITVIGSRILSSYGMEMTQIATSILAKKFVIVSGLAAGADAMAHRTALKDGTTIAVIGNGLNVTYPRSNRDLYQKIKQNGLILSEYPANVQPRKHHFPWRNRILAALGQACIVTQATYRSGTMLTVNEAISLSRDVYCFPYLMSDSEGKGCNILISQGSNIVYDESQLAEIVPKKENMI